jgi:ATP-dependent Clp protease adapter protein ClpS
MGQTRTIEEQEITVRSHIDLPWVVILFNDDYHTFDEVIQQVQKATGCGAEEAYTITYTAHTTGQAVVFAGKKDRCEQVAAILREIDLHVTLEEG